VTITKGIGRFSGHKMTVIDTPGINSLTPRSEDEKVTTDILSKGDIACVVQVADSKNLSRSLQLTLQLARLKLPLVLNLNMSDEAKERGISVDVRKLSERLGIEIVETVATTGDGIARLKDALIKAKAPSGEIKDEYGRPVPIDATTPHRLANLAASIAKEALILSKPLNKSIADFIGRAAVRPLTGIPILIAVVAILYLFVGKFAAGEVVDFVQETIFKNHVNAFFINQINILVPFAILRDFLIGDYGLITMALTYAFAIIFPIVTAFFLFFGILEDSGYLPRLSVLSDRLFKLIGLNGRAILPMVLGLGCGTMATLTTRILETKKERILVTLLLALCVPCSAQLGVIMGLLGSVSITATFVWLSTLIVVMIVIGAAAARLVGGETSPFIQEIPPIRMPQIKNIIVKTFARLKWYLREAVPLFALGTAILFVADKLHILARIEKFFSPLVVTLLGLPEKAASVFILGFLRRDYGAAGLYALRKAGSLDNIQLVVSLIVITLFVPCIAQFFVSIKERGIKVAMAIAVFVFSFAFLVGGAMNFILRYLNILL